MKIDFNGHNFHNRKIWIKEARHHVELNNRWGKLLTNKPSDRIIPVPFSLRRCQECGVDLDVEVGLNTFIVKNPCKYPKGHPALDLKLSVPSGKMVFGNDFRKQFPSRGGDDLGLIYGLIKTSQAYEKAGMIHAFVSNTSLGFYRDKKPNTFYIAYENKPNPLATVSCDLWWYSVADYDNFISKGGNPNNENVINCQPGTYNFKYVWHTLTDAQKDTKPFTYITLHDCF